MLIRMNRIYFWTELVYANWGGHGRDFSTRNVASLYEKAFKCELNHAQAPHLFALMSNEHVKFCACHQFVTLAGYRETCRGI